MPSLILTCFGMGLLLINVFLPRGVTRQAVWISLIGLVVTGFFVYTGWGHPRLRSLRELHTPQLYAINP